ncbi:hypothetical protein HY990_04165 [Candidatus Micrarchaeota archaeon]|nr:hypothetical protein [Candidatus Micrarchaeota archaeon]
MLQILRMSLTGCEVRRASELSPNNVLAEVFIDKIIPQGDNFALIDFTYSIKYLPNIAVVYIYGNAQCTDSEANIKAAIEAHKKNKELPIGIGANLINAISTAAGINSIFIGRVFDLPPHFTPPRPIKETQMVDAGMSRVKPSRPKGK